MEALVCFALKAFFPREGDLPGLAELDVEAKVHRLRRESTFLFWAGLVGAAIFFQLAPIATIRKPLPAALLSADDLDAHAFRIATTPFYPVRQIIVLLKLIGGVFWGESPEIRAFISLPPYGPDPGTRRTEARVARPSRIAREPSPRLVPLGRRETDRGRAVTRTTLRHGLSVDDHEGDEPGSAPVEERA